MARGGLGRAAALAAALFGYIAVPGGTAAAQDAGTEGLGTGGLGAQELGVEALEGTPALITADELSYDDVNGVVDATGNVDITQAGRDLLRDQVTSEINGDVVPSAGNVTLIAPDVEIDPIEIGPPISDQKTRT